jgi:hypothetical protein
MMRLLRLAVVTTLLALVLAACAGRGGDCVSCNSLRDTDEGLAGSVSSLGFQLCVSQVPDPEVTERGCGAVDVQYVVVENP